MRVMRVRVWVQLLLVLVTAAIAASAHAQEYVRDSEPKLMSYDELVQLSQNQELSPELTEQLHILTTTPFINNEAYYRGAKPRPLEVERLGPSLRVAFWNIERGLELDDIELFLTDKDRFMAKVCLRSSSKTGLEIWRASRRVLCAGECLRAKLVYNARHPQNRRGAYHVESSAIIATESL